LAIYPRNSYSAALILPRKPSRYANPLAPAGHVAIGADGAPDLVERLILPDRIINLEDNQVMFARAIGAADRNRGALVLPG
jgi:hypothetical protein